MLSLIQDIVDKIRTSDVGGQMHYLSNWYKQYQDDHKNKDDSPGKTSSTSPGSALKRTSSGRIIKQRVNLAPESDDEDKDKSKKVDETQKDMGKAAPRPTSLNPFRIPVNLLNFKQTQSTLVVKHVE